MSEGWAIDIFNFMVAILCLRYSNVVTCTNLNPGFVSQGKCSVKSNLQKLNHKNLFSDLKKTPDIAEDYILSKIASQKNN